jgi:hypothetical protein
MFIRFRSDGARLYVSLVRTRRVEGKVRQQHVASLGAVTPNRPSHETVRGRGAIWQALHEVVARDQIDAEKATRLMATLQARVPYPTPEQQGAAELS